MSHKLQQGKSASALTHSTSQMLQVLRSIKNIHKGCNDLQRANKKWFTCPQQWSCWWFWKILQLVTEVNISIYLKPPSSGSVAIDHLANVKNSSYSSSPISNIHYPVTLLSFAMSIYEYQMPKGKNMCLGALVKLDYQTVRDDKSLHSPIVVGRYSALDWSEMQELPRSKMSAYHTSCTSKNV